MSEQFANKPNEKSRILIVDNNSQFARRARLFLDQSEKYVACMVIHPRRALETARSFKPDLVLVELTMTQEDGPEVAAQLDADWALHGVPIVFLIRSSRPKRQRTAVAFTGTGSFRSPQAAGN